MSLLWVGCNQPPGPEGNDPVGSTKAAITAALGGVGNDVEMVRFELFGCPDSAHPDGDMDGVPDGVTADQTVISPMGPGFLPDSLDRFKDNPLDNSTTGSQHRYSDGLFVVPANVCQVVRSTPLKGDRSPSMDCYSAARTVGAVTAGTTKELVIVNQCKGRPKAVIDAVAALNHPPELIELGFMQDGHATTKFSSCTPFQMCARVLEPDHDPLSFTLTQVDAYGVPVIPALVAITPAPGFPQDEGNGVTSYCWDVKASKGGSFDLQVVAKDLIWDNLTDPASPKLIPIEDFIATQQHEMYKSRAEQTFPIHAQECDEPCRLGVDVVVTMDTSGSMFDESAALCGGVSSLQAALNGAGISANVQLLAIGAPDPGGAGLFPCLTDTVPNLLGNAVPGNAGSCPNVLNQNESWGNSTPIVAQRFNWSTGALRVIVPISDEGPCNGDPCQSPGPDRDSILNAIAQHGSAVVSPIVAQGAQTCTSDLASMLAAATGGTVFQSTDPAADLVEHMKNLVLTACKKTP
ncbi:MAG TPA: hypothetical protein VN914_02650 [Polyangia bacterium]|nr:hypothetical protein [Polyangia bacterium]